MTFMAMMTMMGFVILAAFKSMIMTVKMVVVMIVMMTTTTEDKNYNGNDDNEADDNGDNDDHDVLFNPEHFFLPETNTSMETNTETGNIQDLSFDLNCYSYRFCFLRLFCLDFFIFSGSFCINYSKTSKFHTHLDIFLPFVASFLID